MTYDDMALGLHRAIVVTLLITPCFYDIRTDAWMHWTTDQVVGVAIVFPLVFFASIALVCALWCHERGCKPCRRGGQNNELTIPDAGQKVAANDPISLSVNPDSHKETTKVYNRTIKCPTKINVAYETDYNDDTRRVYAIPPEPYYGRNINEGHKYEMKRGYPDRDRNCNKYGYEPDVSKNSHRETNSTANERGPDVNQRSHRKTDLSAVRHNSNLKQNKHMEPDCDAITHELDVNILIWKHTVMLLDTNLI